MATLVRREEHTARREEESTRGVLATHYKAMRYFLPGLHIAPGIDKLDW